MIRVGYGALAAAWTVLLLWACGVLPWPDLPNQTHIMVLAGLATGALIALAHFVLHLLRRAWWNGWTAGIRDKDRTTSLDS